LGASGGEGTDRSFFNAIQKEKGGVDGQADANAQSAKDRGIVIKQAHSSMGSKKVGVLFRATNGALFQKGKGVAALPKKKRLETAETPIAPA